MTRMGSGCAALVIGAGFLFGALSPGEAAPASTKESSALTEKLSKPISLVRPSAKKRIAKTRTRVKVAARSRKAAVIAAISARRKVAAARSESADFDAEATTLPAKVADARAEIEANPAPVPAADSSKPLEVAAADQRTELDRATNEVAGKAEPIEPIVKMASVRPAPEMAVPAPASPPLASVQASAPGSANESTLIGKIFIAFGGLLTLASAARMLIA